MIVEEPIPKSLLWPITTGANSAMNQSEFIAVTRNLLKAKEKSRVCKVRLVLLLIGCETGARFLSQSLSVATTIALLLSIVINILKSALLVYAILISGHCAWEVRMVHRSVLIALRDMKETFVEGKTITLFSWNNWISYTNDIFSEKWNKVMLRCYHLNGKANVFFKVKIGLQLISCQSTNWCQKTYCVAYFVVVCLASLVNHWVQEETAQGVNATIIPMYVTQQLDDVWIVSTIPQDFIVKDVRMELGAMH